MLLSFAVFYKKCIAFPSCIDYIEHGLRLTV